MPHEDDFLGVRAPVLTSERQDTGQTQQQSETFRGPEFGEELARSRNLSENFPSEILDFLGPLLIPQQRASARGRENLIDTFRRTGGLKSSFAGQRFKDFERDASLNEIIGLTQGAKSFFAPLAALQQNRLAVAGSPLSRSSGSSINQGSSRSFGFPPPPETDPLALLNRQADITRRQGTIDFLRPGGASGGGAPPLEASGGGGGTFVPSAVDQTTGLPRGSTSFLDPASVSSGGGGGGGIFFDPATGGTVNSPQPGFNVQGGFDSTGGFNNDFGINDFDFNF